MMRHIRDFGALSLTRDRRKMAGVKGVREMKDVKTVRNEGSEDLGGVII